MDAKKTPMVLFGNVAQCRENGKLFVPNLIRAAIESTLIPESKLTLKNFLVRRVFSNGGDITNREICEIAEELCGENRNTYVAILEERGALERLGYSIDELTLIRSAVVALKNAEGAHLGQVPERLHPFEDAVCVAIGFQFALRNRHRT